MAADRGFHGIRQGPGGEDRLEDMAQRFEHDGFPGLPSGRSRSAALKACCGTPSPAGMDVPAVAVRPTAAGAQGARYLLSSDQRCRIQVRFPAVGAVASVVSGGGRRRPAGSATELQD